MEIPKMYEDKTRYAKIAATSSCSLPVSRSSMQAVASRTSRSAAKACRDARKNAGRGTREMFTAVCLLR